MDAVAGALDSDFGACQGSCSTRGGENIQQALAPCYSVDSRRFHLAQHGYPLSTVLTNE